MRWWKCTDVSWDAVVDDYGSESDPALEHWLATVDDRAVGWIQCFAAVDSPEETDPWFEHGIDRSAAGIDYLTASDAGRGQGLGSSMIRTFVDEVVFELHPRWTQACAGPFAANTPSCRALEKAGFRSVGEIDDDEGPCRLMVIDRP